MAAVCAGCLAVFLIGVLVYYRARTNRIEECVFAYEAAYQSVYQTPPDGELSEEELTHIVESVSQYLSGSLKEQIEEQLRTVATELSTGARTVDMYERLISDVSVDYRYGGVRVTVKSYVTFSGYGGYLNEDEDDHIDYQGRCTQILQMEKIDGAWMICSLRTELEKA